MRDKDTKKQIQKDTKTYRHKDTCRDKDTKRLRH